MRGGQRHGAGGSRPAEGRQKRTEGRRDEDGSRCGCGCRRKNESFETGAESCEERKHTSGTRVDRRGAAVAERERRVAGKDCIGADLEDFNAKHAAWLAQADRRWLSVVRFRQAGGRHKRLSRHRAGRAAALPFR